jgi:hypothetical protein
VGLAQTIPDGVGARYSRAAGRALRRRREVLGRHTTVLQAAGWLGLALITVVWVQATAQALRIHSLVSEYGRAQGDALDQWEGRLVRGPGFEQLRLSLEGIETGDGWYLFLIMFPVSLLALYGLWVGCSRWALGHRTLAWRRTALVAAAIVVAQTILLYPEIHAYTSITD